MVDFVFEFVFEAVFELIGVGVEAWLHLTCHAWSECLRAPSLGGLALAAALSSPVAAVWAAIAAGWVLT